MGSGKTEVFLTFSVFGEFEPEDLTARLALEPTRRWVKREPVGNRGRVRERSAWLLESSSELGDTIEPHIAWILGVIEPVAAELVSIRREGAEMLLDCYWSSVGMSGGPWIRAETMGRLARLDLDLVISFYAKGAVDTE